MQQQFEIAVALGEVEVLAVDDQQRGGVVMIEEVAIAARQFGQVVFAQVALVTASALLDPFHQRDRIGLQVDHQIRRAGLRLEAVVKLAVEAEFGFVQDQAGEQHVLFQHEIGDAGRAEQFALAESARLFHSGDQEKQLGGQRVAAAVVVETL